LSRVLLVHAGIADARMWGPQIALLEDAGFTVIAPDLRGFGTRTLEPGRFSHVDDMRAELDGSAIVVGCSFGGRVALELALTSPELVDRLVLIAPAVDGWDWSDEVRTGWEEEEEALERGDFEAAADSNLQLWLDRGQAVDPAVRSLVREMVLRSFELQVPVGDAAEDTWPEPGASARLDRLVPPTLVLVGEADTADMQAIAARIADEARDARIERIPEAAHLPSLEQPEAVNRLLLDFLGQS
jgi:3-oxoadipate enol-lactonase